METWTVGMMTMIESSQPQQTVRGGEMADIDPVEVFDAAMECEGVYVTDGQQGVDNLNNMAKMLGYDDSFGTPLENMLRDNSGMIEAMFEWARENCSTEQAERLESYIPEDHEFEDTTQVIPNSPEIQQQLNQIIDAAYPNGLPSQ